MPGPADSHQIVMGLKEIPRWKGSLGPTPGFMLGHTFFLGRMVLLISVQRITHTTQSVQHKRNPQSFKCYLKYSEVPETEGSTSRMLQAVYGWGQSPPAHQGM